MHIGDTTMEGNNSLPPLRSSPNALAPIMHRIKKNLSCCPPIKIGRKGVQVANLVPAIFPPLFCVEKKRKCQMHIGDATMEDNNSLPSLHSSANALPPIMAFVTTYNPTMSMSGSMYENARSPAPWKWRKVAYGGMQPGFDDNHTDDSFLKDMVTNANVVKRDLWKVILDSVSITQYLCTVALVVLVWTYTLASSISLKTLLLLDVTLLVSGFIVMFLTASMISLKLLAKYMLNILYFIIGLYALSPIYHTLTRSISSDSIWALTTMLIVLHLFLHDYTGCTVKAPGSVANPTLSSNISLNTSIIASVLIASRLPSRELVFAVVLFSLQVFLFAPFIVYCMKRCSTLLYLCFSLGLMGLTLALLYRLQGLLFGMLLGLLVFVNFVCPYWLTRIQKYKFEINGPWDEAKLCFDITE